MIDAPICEEAHKKSIPLKTYTPTAKCDGGAKKIAEKKVLTADKGLRWRAEPVVKEFCTPSYRAKRRGLEKKNETNTYQERELRLWVGRRLRD